MADFSVVTIVKGRRTQLANLLDSVSRAALRPNDIQIVCMDNTNDIVIPQQLPVTLHDMNAGEGLPLAAARNRGIAAAQTNNVIFIDVDCIVSPTLFESMLTALSSQLVITAYPLYLPIVPQDGDYTASYSTALSHPAREKIPANAPVEHREFWSIIFAIQKSTFERVGGFDEAFTGYGAEDTDFAMSFNKAGIELLFVDDHVLHQYHTKHDPPLNHFEAIVRNARLYREKWGEYAMQHWLQAFADMGLLTLRSNRELTVIREPTAQEIKSSNSGAPY